MGVFALCTTCTTWYNRNKIVVLVSPPKKYVFRSRGDISFLSFSCDQVCGQDN